MKRKSRARRSAVGVFIGRKPIEAPGIKNAVRSIIEAEGGGEINLVFLKPGEIARINADYRLKNKPTDVISFPSGRGGDVFISPEEVKKDAKKYGLNPVKHLARVITHGVLHTLGYSHDNPVQKKQMFCRQEKYTVKYFGMKKEK